MSMSIATTAKLFIASLVLLFDRRVFGRIRLRKSRKGSTQKIGIGKGSTTTGNEDTKRQDPSAPTTCGYNATQKILADDGEPNDWFGTSLDVEGEYFIVGASHDDFDGKIVARSTYIFRHDDDGWSQVYKLVHNSPSLGDYFGNCVALSGHTSLVGVYKDDDAGSNAGSLYVFVHNDTDSMWWLQDILTASGASWFGWSCDLDGDMAIVGAIATDGFKGTAYIFVRNETQGWSLHQELNATDGVNAGDRFGYSTVIHGDMAIVGAPGKDGFKGAAYVFARNDTDNKWTEDGILTASNGLAGYQFGLSTTIQGDVAIVGAPYAGHGTIYGFVRGENGWIEASKITAGDIGAADDFGWSTALEGDNVVVGAYGGGAYLFNIEGGVLSLAGELVAEELPTNGRYGVSVGISGTAIVVGARFDDINTPGAGSAYAFNLSCNRTTSKPSAYPSSRPPDPPSSKPSETPTAASSAFPSSRPSASPSSQPSERPTTFPSAFPSSRPSAPPSSQPSDRPTTSPSAFPSSRPSAPPSSHPSDRPTPAPSAFPSLQPSAPPSLSPSFQPSEGTGKRKSKSKTGKAGSSKTGKSKKSAGKSDSVDDE